MKVGVIGAGTMGQGIAKAFAQTEGFTVALCDIKQEWADKGKDKVAVSAQIFFQASGDGSHTAVNFSLIQLA